jgi:glycosyltransferase involved in cell wall biosynthesis
MRILFCPAHYIYDEYYGGSEQHATFEIADRIARRFTTSVVITGKKAILNEKPYRVIEAMPHLGGRDMTFFRAIFFTLAYSLAGYHQLFRGRFDIVHHIRPFHLGKTFSPLLLLGLSGRAPFVIGAFASPYKHNVDAADGTNVRMLDRLAALLTTLTDPILRTLSLWTLQKADAVIVYDQATKALVETFSGIKKVIVIPPGKDARAYAPEPRLRDATKRLSILSVGYLLQRKNVASLIHALAHVRESFPDVELTILGDGPERRRLETIVQELNLGRNVKFLGFVEHRHVPPHFARADIFVHLAHIESFGQVYLEAMASGTPILTSHNAGADQLLREGETARFVSGTDAMEIANTIIALANDTEQRHRMARAAKAEFMHSYDLDTAVIPKYLSLYCELTGKGL